MKAKGFIPHLHCHSEYSLTHGMIRLEGKNEIGKLAAERGIGAVALTDSNNIYGAIRHFQSCLRHGVKPILGCHASFQHTNELFHATLLCENETGYTNLSRILSEAQLETDGKIKVDRLDSKLTTGLIMLTGYEGDVCATLRQGNTSLAAKQLKMWTQLFPDERLACELTLGGRANEEDLTHRLAALAMEANVPAIAAHPVLFPAAADFEAHEVRTCIANSWKLDDPNRPRSFSPDQLMLSAKELMARFAQWPRALANAQEIAMRCNYMFDLQSQPQFPRLADISGEDVHTRLHERAQEGLQTILQRLDTAASTAYQTRLKNELDVIIAKGFSGYFLIVAELVNYAHQQEIPVGPGRGSGAGSLVAYALGITNIDPLKYDLLFERFLNPERTSLPDFDIDFCKDRRDEIIRHARDIYGEDCVSQVITFGSLKAKAVVRDVARVLGMPYENGDTLSRLIPDELHITLTKAREETKDLQEHLSGNEELERLWQFSLALEDLPRQAGTHAAAILISPKPMVEYCPVTLVGDRTKGHVVSQYDKDDAEMLGLIKFDILGLKNLTMLAQAIQMVRAQDATYATFSFDELTYDAPAFEIYRSGNTAGIFQCESAGMVRLLKRIAPRNLEDIAIAISLYRPGALSTKMDEKYIENRYQPNQIQYPHPLAKPVLKPTFGAMIYQEQLMRLSQVLAGFSLAKADVMRAAIGKKDVKKMASLENEFIKGCAEHQLDANKAKAIFKNIQEFAGYGFNKSHAISYALISLQTAYLKAHHPAVFFASSLATWTDDSKTLDLLLRDARTNNIRLLPPCINTSAVQFEPAAADAVRFGLASVRSVGRACASEIIAARTADGPFQNLEDLCQRVPAGILNRRALENLVKAGACDALFSDTISAITAGRAYLVDQVSTVLEYALHEQRHANQNNLFNEQTTSPLIATAPTKPWSRHELLVGEWTAMGITLSGQFLEKLDYLPNLQAKLISTQNLTHKISGLWAGQVAKVITNARMRKQSREVFILDDNVGTLEVLVHKEDLQGLVLGTAGLVVVVNGELEDNPHFHGPPRLKAQQVLSLEKWCSLCVRSVTFNAPDDDTTTLTKLLEDVQERASGPTQIKIKIHNHHAIATVTLPLKITINTDFLVRACDHLGTQAYQLDLRQLPQLERPNKSTFTTH